jgi:hypothetical protein
MSVIDTGQRVLFVKCQQQDYDLLHDYDEATLYFITDTGRIYLGDILIADKTASNVGGGSAKVVQQPSIEPSLDPSTLLFDLMLPMNNVSTNSVELPPLSKPSQGDPIQFVDMAHDIVEQEVSQPEIYKAETEEDAIEYSLEHPDVFVYVEITEK